MWMTCQLDGEKVSSLTFIIYVDIHFYPVAEICLLELMKASLFKFFSLSLNYFKILEIDYSIVQ